MMMAKMQLALVLGMLATAAVAQPTPARPATGRRLLSAVSGAGDGRTLAAWPELGCRLL